MPPRPLLLTLGWLVVATYATAQTLTPDSADPQGEAAAVAALVSGPLPADVRLRAGAFVFPLPDGRVRVPIVCAVSARTLTFATTPDGYRADFTIVARVRTAAGTPVDQGSRTYRLSGPSEARESAQSTDVLFSRQSDLASGVYVLEAAVADALSGRAGAIRTSFTIHESESAAPRVSSLVVVDRTERLAGELPDAADPLAVAGERLIPNLGEPVSRKLHARIPFYISILPAQGASIRATIEVWQGDREVSQRELTLARADAAGRIQYMGQLPTGPLTPGDYTVRVTVTQGAVMEVREAQLTLAP